jgi:hypothetical protein
LSCRWLGLDTSLEPDILQPLASALQQIGLGDVMLPHAAAPATRGNLTAWRRCCPTVLRMERPSVALTGGVDYFDLADAERYGLRRDRSNWVRTCEMVSLKAQMAPGRTGLHRRLVEVHCT